jgi:hypothetical protein
VIGNILSYNVARPCRISPEGGEGVLMALSKAFSVITMFQSEGSLGDNFSELIFYNGEDGLSGSRGRHVNFF